MKANMIFFSAPFEHGGFCALGLAAANDMTEK
jgi:hypothetical protein